jgi:hypothetical protein
VIIYNSKYSYNKQNTLEQNLLLKAMQVTEDPKKMAQLSGIKKVADVYRTLDKIAIRKTYHEALADEGLDLPNIVKGIKRLLDSTKFDNIKLKCYQTVLRSVGLGDYKETEESKEGWEEVIQTAQQHPEVFAKIDKVNFDKGYFVQEKLDEKSLTKDGVELIKYLKDNNILYNNDQDKKRYNGLDILTILYTYPDKIDMLDNTPWENTLKPKIERFFDKLNKIGYGNYDDYLDDLTLVASEFQLQTRNCWAV